MKKKVLIAINDFLVGGAQKLIASQLSYFDKEKYDIELVTFFEFAQRKDLYYLIPDFVKVHRVDMKSAYNIKGWWKIGVLLFRFRPQVVISHLFLSNTLVRVFKMVFWYKVITVEHNTYTNKKKWQIFLDRVLQIFSYRIVAVSEEVRDFTIKQQKLNKDKCVTIVNGIDLYPIEVFKQALTKEEARNKLQFLEDSIIFLSVGRLTNQKNHILLIDSFASFLKQHPNARLFIAGEGELREFLEKRVEELNTRHNIVFLGAIKDIYTYYRASDFLVSTSIIEGMSISYLEALAFGLPVVATVTGGTRSLVKSGQNGVLIESFNKNDVFTSLREILLFPYDKLSEQSARSVYNFSIKENVTQFEKMC